MVMAIHENEIPSTANFVSGMIEIPRLTPLNDLFQLWQGLKPPSYLKGKPEEKEIVKMHEQKTHEKKNFDDMKSVQSKVSGSVSRFVSSSLGDSVPDPQFLWCYRLRCPMSSIPYNSVSSLLIPIHCSVMRHPYPVA
ncbi:hypothetical protein FQR65_LT20379 [Abscondita terminalis]|nr:hypothetical protein FQR65_LT20379 [Abscondita terminalis]